MKYIKPRIVIALDTDDLKGARRMISVTRSQVGMYKVGSILFTAFGPDAVRLVKDAGAEVFLDLKFHDIPNTVRGAVKAAGAAGVDMLTVHASGGIDMMRAALDGAEAGSALSGQARPKVMGVTVLTSLAGEGTLERVIGLASDAGRAGLDGVVCSPKEIKEVKRVGPARLLAVVPGVRPRQGRQHDQMRVGTPAQAARDGADYLVVGRSIIDAEDPASALLRVVEEVENA